MTSKGIELFPDGGPDEDGWVHFKTAAGDRVSVREHPDGKVDLKFPRDKYELKEMYNVESTGDVVIGLVPKEGE